MTHTRLAYAPVLLAVLLSACTESVSEPVATNSDTLHEGPRACGPVYFTGDAYAEKQDEAYASAEKLARTSCEETPMLCAVDCANAPVTSKECSPVVVNEAKGAADLTDASWYCTVTIAASSPEKKCDVWVRCAPGYVSVDTDGDGCVDSCQPRTKQGTR